MAQLNLCANTNFSLLVLFMSTRATAANLHISKTQEFDPLAPVPLWDQLLKSIDFCKIFLPVSTGLY